MKANKLTALSKYQKEEHVNWSERSRATMEGSDSLARGWSIHGNSQLT